MKVLLIFLASNLLAFSSGQELSHAAWKKEELERVTVCIDEPLGCFAETEPGQETSIGDTLDDWWKDKFWRSARETVGTEFRFWAPGKTRATVITNGNLHVHMKDNDKEYDPNLKAIFIIHGYQGGDAVWAVEMKDALMKREPANIFIVDWSGGDGLLYSTAAANTWIVGAELGRLIERIHLKTGMNLDRVHIIGHSLGSHAAGFAGKWLKNKLNKKVRRITGLDVAGPDFEDVVKGERLDRGDAEFVDTIHTNMADSYWNGFGIMKPVGHFDFYPNGGELQPGCPTSGEAAGEIAMGALEYLTPSVKLQKIADGRDKDIVEAFNGLSCNHGRAIEFFIESITSTSCEFIGENCGSYKDFLADKCHSGYLQIPMGYESEEYKKYYNSYQTYKFYLKTNAKSPFCRPWWL